MPAPSKRQLLARARRKPGKKNFGIDKENIAPVAKKVKVGISPEFETPASSSVLTRLGGKLQTLQVDETPVRSSSRIASLKRPLVPLTPFVTPKVESKSESSVRVCPVDDCAQVLIGAQQWCTVMIYMK